MNILIVDDTPDCREPLARLLRFAGHRIATAATGVEALGQLDTWYPDVVVLDLMMPEMDGVTFLRIIRSHERWRTLPVIVHTALKTGPDLEAAQRLGVSRSLTKAAYTADDLFRSIDEACAAG